MQGIPDEQISSRRRELALTILKREDLGHAGNTVNKPFYAFQFCRAYLGLPLLRVRANPLKGQPLEL